MASGGALVVRGEAGIGKSALLGYAVQQAAPGMLVLRADGVEAESDLAFAGLHGLLRPVLAHLRELPEPQSAGAGGCAGAGAVHRSGPAADLGGGARPARGGRGGPAGAVRGR